jgi:hypothetical protein
MLTDRTHNDNENFLRVTTWNILSYKAGPFRNNLDNPALAKRIAVKPFHPTVEGYDYIIAKDQMDRYRTIFQYINNLNS